MNTNAQPGTDYREISSRILLLVSAAILFNFGIMLRGYVSPIESLTALVTIYLIHTVAFGFSAGAVIGVNMKRWGHVAALLATIAGGIGLLVVFAEQAKTGDLGTDAMLFTRYSVDLLLEGHNPYAVSMDAAYDLYPISEAFVTYKVDGTVVTSISYPALSFLPYVPQALLGIPNLNITTLAILFIALIYLISETPKEFALAPFAVVFANPNVLHYSFGGVFDILWVLPILIGMKYWHHSNWRLAAIFVGFAFAVKQTPWIIGPFLAVWLFNTAETRPEFYTRARICLQYGFLGFFIPNLPFIVLNPKAWILSVLTPIAGGADLVKQGIGLVAISASGYIPLPKTWYIITVLGALIVLISLYHLYFERMKWLAWIAPMFVLWFHYRSLQSYFIFFVPIGYYAILLGENMTSEYQPLLTVSTVREAILTIMEKS